MVLKENISLTNNQKHYAFGTLDFFGYCILFFSNRLLHAPVFSESMRILWLPKGKHFRERVRGKQRLPRESTPTHFSVVR